MAHVPPHGRARGRSPVEGGNPIAPGLCRRSSNPPNVPAASADPPGTGCSATTAGSSGDSSGRRRSSAASSAAQREERGGHADVAEWQWLLHPHSNQGEIYPFGDPGSSARWRASVERADHRARTDIDAATATGSSAPTVACSASATRASSVRWAAKPERADHLHRADTQWQRLLARSPPTVACSASVTRASSVRPATCASAAGDLDGDGAVRQGYWLVAGDGGIFSFGVPFYGSVPGTGLCNLAPASRSGRPHGRGLLRARVRRRRLLLRRRAVPRQLSRPDTGSPRRRPRRASVAQRRSRVLRSALAEEPHAVTAR